jgi:hypothetical protein
MQKTKSFDGLMRIPLLRQVFADPNIRVVYRAIDNNWKYNQVFRRSVSGFNPYLRTVFLAKNSVIATWIKNGKRQDRIYNENDRLVGEVLFMMHDYLHCWAITVIQQAMPSLKLGWGKITEKNFEKYVFCHLLTEAVATVGLDYWFLSTINLSTYCDLGTNMDILTVSFHESKLREYQKFNQNLNVQSPNFFKFITKFYCDGQMHGFSKSDINKSPQLSSWLEHELTYGEQQRKYSRMWISHLSGKKNHCAKRQIRKTSLR